MIQVFYWPREQRLIMTGHAEEKGLHNPVVCGAASTLFEALCTTSNGFQRRKLVHGHYFFQEKGIGYFRMWPRRWHTKRTLASIGTVVAGMLLLEEKHPPLIHVNVATGIPCDDVQIAKEYAEGGVSYLKKFVYDNTKDRPLDEGTENNRPRRKGRKEPKK